MKKAKLIALTLVVAIMMVGAGYAYWSDSVNINGTVNTGEFKVEFINGSVGYVDHGESGATNYTTLTEPILTNTDPNTARLAISNMYPGKEVTYTLKVKNKGSIPAVFKDASVSYKGSDSRSLKKLMAYKCGLSFGSPAHFVSATDFETSIETLLNGLELAAGEEKEIKGAFYLSEDVDNTDDVEDSLLVANITINWTQHNDPNRSK